MTTWVDVRLSGRTGLNADMVAASANDPLRTLAIISCCSSEGGFCPYQSAHLNRYDAIS